ncbi:OmpA family protein [Nitrosomonas sp.]|uniref:OmpA family protein n=1 Tax=Nitrosomonas sp. TaxID=42353 RepID=UPI001D8FB6FD|nr:OmpA family protein [Nitrosomonas sp.]MCB1949429.1 OmpA family protein [Nitrosomonas sp.]MCP5243157.1 OmpA family protein [Burkholderiales bacterium]MDR4513938.1 OmpA family protein [Nitrosomonas sp.]
MNKLSAKKKLIGMILLPAFFSGTVAAQVDPIDRYENDIEKAEGYAVEDENGVVWRSSPDLGHHCWRTGYWDESLAVVEGCDGYEKVAEAEPEAPAPAPVTPPEKLTFSADALFDFDSAVLKPNGKVALDEFARGLEGINYDVIVAVGHADRIGNPDYNQRLSVRRAESVKAYLVSKGIPDSRIFTDGKGETQPVTGSTCDGKGGAALKECLRPDRRVEVEVAGSR